MYNVLEALRARCAPTPKEQATHDAGLVSVLRQVHDELDSAVATAYGWPTNLSDAEILTRLVALNRKRAAESANGHVRWLRPVYQNRAGASAQESLGITAGETAKPKRKRAASKQPWPASLASRVQLGAFQAAPGPVTATGLAKQFARAKPDDLAEILETLATLGRVHRAGRIYSLGPR